LFTGDEDCFGKHSFSFDRSSAGAVFLTATAFCDDNYLVVSGCHAGKAATFAAWRTFFACYHTGSFPSEDDYVPCLCLYFPEGCSLLSDPCTERSDQIATIQPDTFLAYSLRMFFFHH